MTKFRLSVRVLLVLVALVALGTGVVVLGRRSVRYWELAEHYSEVGTVLDLEASNMKGSEAAYRMMAARGVPAPAGESWASLIGEAEAGAALRHEYAVWSFKESRMFRRASYRPWESVTIEPSTPWSR